MTVNQGHVGSFKRSRRRGALGPMAFVVLMLVICVVIGRGPYSEADIHTDRGRQIGSSEPTVTGRVSHVRDGDTIEIGEVAIRLRHLDCPERSTERGNRATQQMRGLVRDAELTCVLSGRKSYDRYTGMCRLSDGRDLTEVMIEASSCTR